VKKLLIIMSAWIAVFCAYSFAGELFDDFLTDEVDEDAWWVKTTGNATAEIKNGELILSSHDVPGSIYLLYKEAIPPGEPITVEIRMNLQANPNDGWFGFLKDFPGDSHVNTVINDLKDATMFFVSGGGGQVQPRGEGGARGGNVNIKVEEFHIFKIEITDTKYRIEVDDKEVLDGSRDDGIYTNRAIYIAPDGFDSHYENASFVVDWIRLSGPTIPQRLIAVDALWKLPIVWGKVKQGWPGN